ncbi:MAG: hypothetical protein JWR51_4625 [Devosia sp.]|nr:hypothetical protein [Devosia sp.]
MAMRRLIRTGPSFSSAGPAWHFGSVLRSERTAQHFVRRASSKEPTEPGRHPIRQVVLGADQKASVDLVALGHFRTFRRHLGYQGFKELQVLFPGLRRAHRRANWVLVPIAVNMPSCASLVSETSPLSRTPAIHPMLRGRRRRSAPQWTLLIFQALKCLCLSSSGSRLGRNMSSSVRQIDPYFRAVSRCATRPIWAPLPLHSA